MCDRPEADLISPSMKLTPLQIFKNSAKEEEFKNIFLLSDAMDPTNAFRSRTEVGTVKLLSVLLHGRPSFSSSACRLLVYIHR